MNESKKGPESFKLYKPEREIKSAEESKDKRAWLKRRLTAFLAVALGVNSLGALESRASSAEPKERQSVENIYDYYGITEPSIEAIQAGNETGTNVFGSHFEIDGIEQHKNDAIEIRQTAVQLLDQMNQNQISEDGEGKVMFFENDIKSDRNWGDYNYNTIYQRNDGTFQEFLEAKKPKLSNFIRLGVGIGGMMNGKIGDIARTIDRQLNQQVAPKVEVYGQEESKDLTVTSRIDLYEQNAAGEANPKKHKEKVVNLPFVITRTLAQGNASSVDYRSQSSGQKVVYRLFMAEEYSQILGKDGHNQYKVVYDDEGKGAKVKNFKPITFFTEFPSEAEAMKAAAMYASIYTELEFFGKESQTFNNTLARLNQAGQVVRRQVPGNAPATTPETRNSQFFPIPAEVEKQVLANKEGYLEMTTPLQVGQEILLQGPTKNIKVKVLSVEQKPAQAGGNPTYKVRIRVEN